MSFLHFLLVVVSLGCGTLPPVEGVELLPAVTASAGLLLGWAILCHIAATQLVAGVRKGQIDAVAAANYLDVQLGIFRWFGLGVVAICLAGFGLAPALAASTLIGPWMSIQAILFLIPASALVAMTASSQWTFMNRIDGGGGNCPKYIVDQLRRGMAWLALPVVVLMGVADLIGLLPLSPEISAMAIPLASIVMVLAGLPILTRWIFRSGEMSEERRRWYASLIQSSGGGRIGVTRWDTGSMSSNALVAGFVPPWRRLWITDRIEDELPRSQIAMIVLHEVGHLRRRHMPLRMLALLPAWAVGLLTTRALEPWAMAEAVGLAIGLLATLIALRLVSHATEYDADAWACRAAAMMGGEIEGVPASMQEAAESLSMALRRVTLGADPSKSTWLHPSVDCRVDRLRNEARQSQILAV